MCREVAFHLKVIVDDLLQHVLFHSRHLKQLVLIAFLPIKHSSSTLRRFSPLLVLSIEHLLRTPRRRGYQAPSLRRVGNIDIPEANFPIWRRNRSLTCCTVWPYHIYGDIVIMGVGDYIGRSSVGARWLAIPHRI